ncbi:MAG: hypothetical protein FJY82_14885 [Candidatus Aminicenantes bacterium]|nr:hypothetical protein [Candidatus Aminicenantes bacterium]
MRNRTPFASVLPAALVVFALAAPLSLGAAQSDTRFAFKEEIFVGPSQVQDNVVSFGGTVTVEGKIRKAVFAIGGTVTISGEVGESVVVIGGRVRILPTAVVGDDLVVLGGTLVKETGCSVGGDTVYFKTKELSDKFFKGGLLGFLSASLLPVILIVKFVILFIWALVVFVVAMLFPRQVKLASDQVRSSFGSVFATGLLALVAFTVFIVIAAVLSIVLIGIPILVALAFAGMMIKAFGRVAVLFFFGESLARAFNRRSVSALGGAMLGLLVVGVLTFVPIIGWLFTGVIDIVGWGVTIRTKFGTTESAFRRTPRTAAPPAGPPPPPAPVPPRT